MFLLYSKMAKNALKLSMVGVNFGIGSSEMARTIFKTSKIGETFEALKSPTMAGENIEIPSSKMSKNARKSSIIIGENVEIQSSKMSKNSLK